MKKRLLSFSSFVITVITVNAQITINASNVPAIGKSTLNANDTGSISVNIGSAGANQAWNLTSLQNETLDTSSMLDPAGTACAGKFPSANVAMILTDGLGYANISSSGFEFVGSCQPFASDTAYFDFNPPLKLITFPSTYQTAYTGTSGFGFTNFYGQSGIDSVKFSHSQNYSSLIDGWGTVSTPAKANVNSLRQRVIENSIDSIWGKGLVTGNTWMFLQESKDSSISYRWYTNTTDFIIAEIKTNKAGDTVKAANYLLATLNTGIKNEISSMDIMLYPNPSSEKITFSGVAGVAGIIIYDATARIISRSLLQEHNSTISVSNYENGIYFYQISDMNGNFLKQGKFSVAR